MALLFEHTSETATDEADVDTSAGKGTAWTSVSKTGACTIKWDTALAKNGSRSIRFTRANTTDSGFCRATLGVAVARMQVRSWVYMTALPTAGLDLYVHRHAAGFMGYMSIGLATGGTADGKLVFRNATGASINASKATATFPLSQWVRVESVIKAGTTTTDGTFEYAYYLGDSTTAIFSWSSTAENTGTANPIEVRFGLNGASITPASIWMDDPALGDGGTGFLGTTAVVPPVASVSGQVVHLIDATASTLASGTKTYGIAQTSGPAATPTLISTGVWSVPPHTTTARVYDVTVTGSLGGSDVESYTVTPLSPGTSTVVRLVRSGGLWS